MCYEADSLTHCPPDGVTPVLRGKRGTLKRRCELRGILEHDSNNNGQDDLFQSTPFRAKHAPKVGVQSTQISALVHFISSAFHSNDVDNVLS